MTSYYVVVTYVPDPVIDERINIGVVVYGDGQIRSQFVRNWQRVKQFGNGDIGFLQDFALRVQDVQSLKLDMDDQIEDFVWSEEIIKKAAGSWINSIQFSQPKASLKPAADLFADVSVRFLRESVRKKRSYRDRRAAASVALRSVRDAVQKQKGVSGLDYVKRGGSLTGKLDKHQFDVSVSNGRPFFAAQGLSFEVPDGPDLRKDIDSTAWAVDDVRKGLPDLPLAVVMIPPASPNLESYSRAVHVFESLNATVVTENNVGEWAARMASTIS